MKAERGMLSSLVSSMVRYRVQESSVNDCVILGVYAVEFVQFGLLSCAKQPPLSKGVPIRAGSQINASKSSL